jgi:hypothetical protein
MQVLRAQNDVDRMNPGDAAQCHSCTGLRRGVLPLSCARKHQSLAGAE